MRHLEGPLGPFSLESDDASFLRFVSDLWGPARGGAHGAPPVYDVALHGPPGPVLTTPGGFVRLDTRDPGSHAYHVLVGDLLTRDRGVLAFHAAAVARRGRAVVIAGPSGHGKTTLATHLAVRGFTWLSDDLTLVDRASGAVRPVGRATHLRPGARALLPREVRARARGAARRVSGGVWTVPPRAVFGRARPASRIAAAIFLVPVLTSSIGCESVVEVRVVAGREGLLDSLARLDGVVAVTRRGRAVARVRTRRTEALQAWLRRHDVSVASSIRHAARRPDFGKAPRFERIGPFEASLLLAREMVNRRPGGPLDEEFRGRETALVGEIAGHLAGAVCLKLRPGRLSETLEVLESALASAR